MDERASAKPAEGEEGEPLGVNESRRGSAGTSRPTFGQPGRESSKDWNSWVAGIPIFGKVCPVRRRRSRLFGGGTPPVLEIGGHSLCR